MEADWSVEIGPSLPRVDGSWDGFANLRKSPEAIDVVAEAREYPALREALLALNSQSSPVFTAKCDAWPVPGEEIDPDEFNAARETAGAGFASYIDIIERDAARFASFGFHERRVRELTATLRGLGLQQGRVDFVIRAAVFGGQSGFGVTLYAAGCGVDPGSAQAAWRAVLGAVVAATIAGVAYPSHAGE